MNDLKKQELIDIIAQVLDISPQMYAQSTAIVDRLEKYLKNQDKTLQIYKQGSFKLGTITSPYDKDKEGDYDIDLVVQFSIEKSKITAGELKKLLFNFIKGQNYGRILEDEKRRCWTLDFSFKNEPFHIDLLPCVQETNTIIENLKINPYVNTSVAITNIVDKQKYPYQYEWKTSNPKGFAKWFDNINYSRYTAIKKEDKNRILRENSDIFKSIADISDDYSRSPLQKVIQILKRHRDVYFCNNSENAPVSILITTLVGKIIEENKSTINRTYDLLQYVLEGLEYYAKLTFDGKTSETDEDFKEKKLIAKRVQNGKVYWSIQNPSNSVENFADKWNENPKKPQEFFKWVKQAKKDLIDILEGSENQIKVKITECLGKDVCDAVLKKFNFETVHTQNTQKLSFSERTPKPYKA